MSSQDLLAFVVSALTDTIGATDAGNRVYAPGDWPTQPDQYPIIKLRLTAENRTAISRSGPPQFTTTANVQIVGEVSAPAEADNAGAVAAENSLWSLKRQIEVAFINSYPLMSQIQKIASMNSTTGFDATGSTHLAVLQMDVALEFYEGPEDFAPIDAGDIDEVDVSVPDYPPTGLTADPSQ